MDIRDALGPAVADILEIFLHPDVTDDYSIEFTAPDLDGVIRILCEEREFAREQVAAAVERTYR